MTTSSRLSIALFVSTLSVPLLAPTCWAQERPPAAVAMSKTFGLDSYAQVEKVRFTFNVELPGAQLARTWEFEPKTDQVTYEGKDKDGKPVKVTYNRARLGSESDTVKNEIEPNFTNDEYWFFFPFHVSWDDSAKVTDEGAQKLPLGDGSGDRIVVKYPDQGGYAPGDTWDLYLGDDHRIKEMAYHAGAPGVQKRPKLLIVTWAGYKKAGPLLVSTDHVGTTDGKPVRVFFSDVAVKVTGSDNWVNAQ